MKNNNDTIKVDTEWRTEPSTRQVVEGAIDFSKKDKTTKWDAELKFPSRKYGGER